MSDDLKVRHPEIDWHAISGFRNAVVRNHLGLDAGLVWQIVQDDLPLLAEAVRQMRADPGE